MACGSVLLGIIYFAGGLLGFIAQSAQSGVTPIWPPSGVAFAAFMLFGIRYWPGVLIGMLLLAQTANIPTPIALIATFGSILEAAIPVLLLRRLGFHRDFPHSNDVLLFVGLAIFLGPAFSATTGALGFYLLMDSTGMEVWNLWLFWWLGNGLGIVTFGAFLLTWWERRNISRLWRIDILLLVLASLTITYTSIQLVHHVSSTLIMFLITPVVVIAAIRHGPPGVTLVSISATLGLLFIGHYTNPSIFQKSTIDIAFLNIAFIAISTATGLLVSSAFAEFNDKTSLLFRASHDSLTGLLNRGEFEQRLEYAIAEAKQHKLHHCLLFLDLDETKQVNDTAGHMAGDELLRQTAKVLRASARSGDSAARIGGDEFAILLWNCPIRRGEEIAGLIQRDIAQPFTWNDNIFHTTTSIGMSVIDSNTTDLQSAWLSTDNACYQAKRSGGNSVAVDPSNDLSVSHYSETT